MQIDTEFRGNASAYIAAGIRHELESASKDGYVSLTDNGKHYKATLIGAYLITWSQIPPFKQFVVAKHRRRARKRLQEVGIG